MTLSLCFLSIVCPVAFLFNWIGFFLSFCLTTSAAGRYGAISGFGLSLIKWILIVRVRRGAHTHKHRHYTAHIQTHKMWFYVRTTTQKPQTPLWYFNVVSVVVGFLALHYFLKDLLEGSLKCRSSLSETSAGHIYSNQSFLSFCWVSSSPHISPVTLMDSTGCGGCS